MDHAFIDARAAAGADAVKFRTHIAAAESTPAEPWRTPFSKQDATRYDYWKRMEFTEEQWHGLKLHADERGLRSEEHTSELQSLMRTSYAVFCLKKKKKHKGRMPNAKKTTFN